MLNKLIIFIILISSLFSQNKESSWLEIKLNSSSNSVSKNITAHDSSYFTIQIAAKKSFSEAYEMVQELNNQKIEAYIQKNENDFQFNYRVRFGYFSNRNNAEKFLINLKELTNCECWIDRIEL